MTLLPFVGWIKRYDRAALRFDLVAALTVAVVAVPQSMAYALIAGLPVQYGLFAAIVPCIVGALWGSSAQLITGPTNAISLVVFSTLSGIAEPYSGAYIQLALTLAFMTGVVQFALGLARLGVLVNFVSHSVVLGFTAGAGVLIGIKQLHYLLYDPHFSASLPKADSIIVTLWTALINLPHLHLSTLALGLLSMVTIALLKRLWPSRWGTAPGPLLAMLLCGLMVAFFAQPPASVVIGEQSTWVATGLFGLDGATRVVGEIPHTLPPLSLPTLNNFTLLQDLFNAALAIALLGLLEAVSIAKAISLQTRQRLDGNQEFIGQGLSNIAAAFFSSYTGSGSFTRSAVNHKAGAISPMSGVLSGIFVAITVLLFAGYAAYLPISALSGMLLMVAFGMVDRHALKMSLNATRSDRSAVIVTFLATIFLHLEYAVFIGVALSLALYLAKTTRPQIHEWAADGDSFEPKGEDHHHRCPNLPVIHIDGSLFFGSMGWVNEAFHRITCNYPDAQHMALSMAAVNHIDATGVHGLQELNRVMQQRGGGLFLIRAKPGVIQVLINGGLLDKIGRKNIINRRVVDALPLILKRLNWATCSRCAMDPDHNDGPQRCNLLRGLH